MKKILYIISFLVFGATFAQENKTSDCNLQSENDLWKTEYENSESNKERIELIKEKIKSDSIYSYREPKIKINHNITFINQHVDKKGTECGCKILFILNYQKQKTIIVNLNERPELNIVVNSLNTENVEQVMFSFDQKTAQDIYGTSSKCGFVQLKVTDRKLKRLIKNVWQQRL